MSFFPRMIQILGPSMAGAESKGDHDDMLKVERGCVLQK